MATPGGQNTDPKGRSTASFQIHRDSAGRYTVTHVSRGKRHFLAWDFFRYASGYRRACVPSELIREYQQTRAEAGEAMMRPGK